MRETDSSGGINQNAEPLRDVTTEYEPIAPVHRASSGAANEVSGAIASASSSAACARLSPVSILLNDVSAAQLPTVWNAAAIRQRTAALFKDAMVIWPYPAA